MVFGIIIIVLILVFTSVVILQETFRQQHWRKLVAEGNVEAIEALIQDEIEHWHNSRVPKGTPALLWHGIQTVELTDVTATGARLNCTAEGESALTGGRRVETSSPLSEGMKITLKLAEMLLYDVPNVKLDHVQIDVYTSFRNEAGQAEPRCILSTLVERHAVEHIDWEEITPPEFVDLTEGRFGANGSGGLQAIEPIAWASGFPRGD